MDERQSNIEVGAGLEESRVNEELLDFLNKWSFPALLVIALISGGYYAMNMFEQRKVAKRDDAFGQLAAVESSQDPSVYSLTEIADQFEGVGSVSEIARLRAADVHLGAVRTGVDPAEPEKELTAEDRAYKLEQAESLYRKVLASVEGDADRALIAANAAFGLAAVFETRGSVDEAKAQYEKAKMYAERAGFAPLAEVAAELMETAGTVEEPTLYEQSQLPRLPFQEPPAAPTETDLGVDSGLNFTLPGPEVVDDEVGPSVTPIEVPAPRPTPDEEPAPADLPAEEPPAADPTDPPADDPND